MSESVVLLPNLEALVSDFLRDQAEIVALVGDRVYTALPSGVQFPAMRVTQFYSLPLMNRPLWLTGGQLQIEAWGGTKGQAFGAVTTAMGVMAARLTGVHAFGCVTGVDFAGLRDQPDENYEPAKPRWLCTATVYAHPLRP